MQHHHKETFKKHVHSVKKHGKSTWQWVKHHTTIVFFGSATLLIILLGIFIIWIATMKAPTLDSFNDRKISNSIKILDRTGEFTLYDVNSNIKRINVESDAISQNVKNAVIAIEDKNFYDHNGIQSKAILRAIISQIIPNFGSGSQGGSTITQQLIKNTLLTQEKSVTRKVKEWVLAVKIERIMSKDEILTFYLNESPYGGTIYGIEEASNTFFNKKALDITLAEAAYLAAIPNAPTYYSPYGKNRPNLNARKNLVLRNMFEQNYITEEEYLSAKKEEVIFRPISDSYSKAIHFVEYIRSYLEKKYGSTIIDRGGLTVTTTLDWELQQVAEKTIKENALKNEKDYGASNSALIALDPKTGQILSMVGSRDYSDRTIDGAFNVATANRQPGSSFKPLVYARAFEKGFQPETVLFDVPTQFGSCGAFDRSMEPPCYAPDNYDNKYLGPLSLRNALAQSRNIPAVKLLSLVGLSDALQTAKKLGLSTLDRNADRYGLTLVLGGGEVTLLDLTSVYGVFANDGVRNPPVSILEIKKSDGTILESFTQQSTQVIDYNAARKLSSVLSDNGARTPLFGSRSFFYFGNREVAGKTGTTSDNKDAWVVGYTPSIVVGVWTGNNDNTPMRKGSSISGPAWRTFMDAALKKLPYDSFPKPELDADYYSLAPILRGQWAGGESFWIDTISGKLATEFTPPETRKEFVFPEPHSILYWVDPKNPRGPKPVDPTDSSQFSRWEATVQQWVNQNSNKLPPYPIKPVGEDPIHTEENKPLISFIQPLLGSVLEKTNPITLQISVQSNYLPVKNSDYYLNGHYVGSSTTLNNFTFIPEKDLILEGENKIRVVVTDSVYNRGESELLVFFK